MRVVCGHRTSVRCPELAHAVASLRTLRLLFVARRTLIKELLRTQGIAWAEWIAEERIFGLVLRSLLEATVAGGAAIAFTGGLAAPAIAAGVGAALPRLL